MAEAALKKPETSTAAEPQDAVHREPQAEAQWSQLVSPELPPEREVVRAAAVAARLESTRGAVEAAAADRK